MALVPLRLITLPISHYCEKVRWALERQGVPYREEGHAPVLHMLATLPATGFHSRTTPVLIDENPGQRHVFDDSTAILRYLEQRYGAGWLFAAAEAAALEDEFDHNLGPHTRRVFYFHMLPEGNRLAAIFATGVPRIEATLIKAGFPLVLRAMRRGMKISAEGAQRSLQRVEEVFTRVNERLADGRRYLCGDAFGAADLTFAALASPLLLPPSYGVVPVPTLEEVPPAARSIIARLRATPAGQFALRLYAEERRRT